MSAARGQQRLNQIGSTSYPSERGNDVEPNQKQLSEASVTNSDDIQIQHTEEYNCDTSTDETLLLYQNNIEDLYDTGLDLVRDPYFYKRKRGMHNVLRTRGLNIIADVVDTIAEVAFVIPTFHEQVIEDISERRFYSVPTKFLMRDEYGNMSFEEQISFSVQNDELSKKYLKAQNKTQRDKMYRLLLDTLARNGGPVDAADDSTTSSGDEDDVDMI